MKLNLLKILFAVFLFTACSSDSDNNNENTPSNPCQTPATFTVVQNDETITVNAPGNASANFELSFSQNEGNPDSGHMETFSGSSKTFLVSELFLEPGNIYYFYVRTICSSQSKSDWSGVRTVTIASYCGTPYNLNVQADVEGPSFTWSSSNSNASFEVEYGPAGFAIGNGTRTDVGNNTSYSGMPVSMNTQYDFYVRSFCEGLVSSDWAGPFTYLSPTNSNLCTQPSNLSFTMEGPNAVGFHWDYNGEYLFEYALISGSQTIGTATLETIGTAGTPVYTGLSSFIQYQFYVRAVCSDGNRTPWTTILVDF